MSKSLKIDTISNTIYEEVIQAVEIMSETRGNCPHCGERILPYPNFKSVGG